MTSQINLPRYPHVFGKKSLTNLEGVAPMLVDVATLAIMLCRFDGTVLPGGGVRSEAQARANVAAGTGILDSRHRKQVDGFGHAIDLVALTPDAGGIGRVNWNNLAAFREMASAVKVASAFLRVPIRQGCDWNMNGEFGEAKEWDWPHFENPVVGLRARADAEMQRFRAECVASGVFS